MLIGLRMVRQLQVRKVDVHSDFQLVINQVEGHYEARDERMARYLDVIKRKAYQFDFVSFTLVPKEKNDQVDALTNLGSSSPSKQSWVLPIEFLEESSFIETKKLMNRLDTPTSSQMNLYVKYLKDGALSKDEKEAYRLRVKDTHLCLINDH